jgi:hypothetical protein
LNLADGEDVGGLVHVQVMRRFPNHLEPHEADVPIARRQRGLDEQRVRRVERLIVHPQAMVDAHSEDALSARWYVADAVTRVTSFGGRPASRSASFNRPADTCNTVVVVGATLSRAE